MVEKLLKLWICVAVISSQPNNLQSRLFLKRKQSSWRYAVALLFALALILADHHYRYLHRVRSGFSVLVSPMQFAVDYSDNWLVWMHGLLTSKQALLRDNQQLKSQQLLLQAQLQKLLVLQEENAQLKKLLSTSSGIESKVMVSKFLAVDTSSARQLLVLNKGNREGIAVGLPVLDAHGVMGQVIDVGSMTSTVLLISDAKSAVPVQNNRTGERAILVGTNRLNQLSLINLPKSSSIMVGDLLITSGLGGRYPEGYPVGYVEEVKNVPGDEFIKVIVRPAADLSRNQLVLVVWPEREHFDLMAQIHQRLNVLEGKG